MNDNSGETPNPLNPTPNMSGGVTGQSNDRPVVEEDYMSSETVGVYNDGAIDEQVSMRQTVVEPTMPMEQTTTGTSPSLDPSGRTMEQMAAPIEPKKKKKTGLIVGAIVCILVAIGCAVAAVVIALSMQTGDAVNAAMNKIIAGDTPQRVVVDGDVNIKIKDLNSPISQVKLHLNSEVDNDTGSSAQFANSVAAEVTVTLVGMGDVSFEFDEAYTKGGDLYFRVDGIKTALENLNLFQLLSQTTSTNTQVNTTTTTNCETNEVGETNCATTTEKEEIAIDGPSSVAGGGFDADMILSVIEIIDGEWLKISPQEMNLVTANTLNDSTTTCFINLVEESGLAFANDEEAALYKEYPFITSTDKNIKIARKENPIYMVNIDGDNLVGFVNAMQGTKTVKDFYSCLGYEGDLSMFSIDSNTARMITEQLPDFYVEIDGNNNFTRLYFDAEIGDGIATITTDLGFRYPDTSNIEDPDEYQDFSEVIQEIFTSMYDI